MGTSYSTVCTSITVNHICLFFGCIHFTALKYTIDADGKSMQFITIGQIVLLLLYLAYAAILQEMLL